MNLVWFRNDLRLNDNPALYHACLSGDSVRAVYLATPNQWRKHHEAAIKLGFRSAALQNLRNGLAERGIVLDIAQCDDFSALPKCLTDYCLAQKITHLFFNQEIALDEQVRDTQVQRQLNRAGISCQPFNADLLIATPATNLQGQPYRVFTPWYKTWLKQIAHAALMPLPKPVAIGKPIKTIAQSVTLPGSRDFRKDLWPADEEIALNRLIRFTHRKFDNYSRQRDYPAICGTSMLSPYLASGLLSPRRCLMAIQQTACEQGWDWRESSWLRELGWREFYRHLLLNFPRINKGKPFRQSPAHWPWQNNPEALKAWQGGHTGFPIIDAAMKQLLQTGWMHNRLRMLTASFLCKLLLIDWREGERFFMQHLIDGDFASNNGGWQWSASTGCDASPWFRIFNPVSQSRKFDPDGDFIRKFLPELACLDNRQIHEPSDDARKNLGYCDPIINYKAAREQALRVLKN